MQRRPDLLACQPVGHQSGHLELPGAEATRPSAAIALVFENERHHLIWRQPLTLGPQLLRVLAPQACGEFGPQLRDPLSYTRGSMDTGPLGVCGPRTA